MRLFKAPPSPSGSHYGMRPQVKDPRDFKLSEFRPKVARATVLPESDMRLMCSPIEDQGPLGSCVGQAVVGSMEYLRIKAGLPNVDLSRLMAYGNGRIEDGSYNEDVGTSIRSCIKGSVKRGICEEYLWPYDVSRFASRIPCKVRRAAMDHQITGYYAVTGLEETLSVLSTKFIVTLGIAIYESFELSSTMKTGVIPMPKKKSERLLGWHAIDLVGHLLSKSFTWLRNSWGTGVGLSGYFQLPFGFLEDPELSMDFWTIEAYEGLPT